MRFDDRLLTVLNQPSEDRRDAAVRWRQLVDLVARAGPNSDSPTVAQALQSIRDDAGKLDESARAAAARAVAALPLPIGLLEYFASDSLQVSAPVLAAATLEPAQWRALLASADEETKRFIETLHPELGDAPPPDLTEALVEAPKKTARGGAGPSLSDVVARIERRRRSRMAQQAPSALAPGTGELPSLFRWECGASGEISWVEGAPRGPLIGRSIARSQDALGGVDAEVSRAFALRAPFRDGTLTMAGEGLLAGKWRISGVPAFEPSDGRFAGYRGIALREEGAATAEPSDQLGDALADPDSLRELVHEIKTPLNAIIGFAEIIDGQYLGPADHRYRERAAEIVSEAGLLLTAIDDLDFAAKARSATSGRRAPRTKLAQLVERVAPELRERASERGATIEVSRVVADLTAAVEPELAERLVVRMCSAAIDQAGEGEKLRLSVDRIGDRCRVSIGRPKALQGVSEGELFAAGDGMIGGAFLLRLVRGLSRIAGADVVASASAIALAFPCA